MYIHREIESSIVPFLERKEALAILGPRQAGKTTLLNFFKTEIEKKGKKVMFISFENRSDLNMFQDSIEDFKKIINPYDCVLIDEFQYAKNGGQKLKYLYDSTKIKFIISGSSSLDLTFQTGKYMVGRMIDFTLLPFSFKEFLSAKKDGYSKLIGNNKDIINFKHKDGFGEELTKVLCRELEEYVVFGGYPAVVLSETEEEKIKVLENIGEKYLLKDISSLLKLATEEELIILQKFLANQIGNLINFNELSNPSGLNYPAVKKHLKILEKTYVISLLKPYFTNRRTELTKNPKPYFIDLGLRNYSLSDFRPLFSRNDAGALMENYAFGLFSRLYPGLEIKYWRTKSKAEVDFIIEKEQTLIPVEIKYNSKKAIGKSFHSFLKKFNSPVGVILTKDFLGEEKINGTLVKFIPLCYF